jgi:hypothetical protein
MVTGASRLQTFRNEKLLARGGLEIGPRSVGVWNFPGLHVCGLSTL